MTKTETEKDILALRYPIDVDVTDDIAKKRSEIVVFAVFKLVFIKSIHSNKVKVGIYSSWIHSIQ